MKPLKFYIESGLVRQGSKDPVDSKAMIVRASKRTHIFASFVAFIKLEIRQLKENISWYEQKAIINRDAVNNYLRANA